MQEGAILKNKGELKVKWCCGPWRAWPNILGINLASDELLFCWLDNPCPFLKADLAWKGSRKPGDNSPFLWTWPLRKHIHRGEKKKNGISVSPSMSFAKINLNSKTPEISKEKKKKRKLKTVGEIKANIYFQICPNKTLILCGGR